MEAKSAKRLTYESYEVPAEDRISGLPKDIVHRIFSILPVDCVARTCVLSKFWRCMWYSYPILDFTTSSASLRFVNGGGARPGDVDRFDEVLRSLEKRSDLTVLKCQVRTTVSGILGLIRVAVEHNVRELDLEFSAVGRFSLPLCIVSSLSLRELRLSPLCYGIRLPPLDVTMTGFKSLASLWLSRVDLSVSPVDFFTDPLFPSLTKLHLELCSGLRCVKVQLRGLSDLCIKSLFDIVELDISGEKIKKLRVVGCFSDSSAAVIRAKIDAPLLESIVWSSVVADECVFKKCDSLEEADVILYLHTATPRGSKMRGASNFLAGISQCCHLRLNGNFIEILSRTYPLASSESLQWPVFGRLESLQVNIQRDNTPKLASLFRSSPAVSEITIWIKIVSDFQQLVFPELPEDMRLYWESKAQSLDSFLRHLKLVSIVDDESEANCLVEFFFNHGKSLQWITMSNDQGLLMFKDF